MANFGSNMPKILNFFLHFTYSMANSSASSVEASVSNYSKRNSQFVNELNNFTSPSPSNTPQNALKPQQIVLTFSLPPVKQVPIYISSLAELANGENDPHGLLRIINLDAQTCAKLHVEKQSESTFIVGHMAKSEYAHRFLPGDQLISVNNAWVFGKSLADVKHMLNPPGDEKNDLVRIQVRTNLVNAELVARNTSHGLLRMQDYEIMSLKRAGSMRRKFNERASLNESTNSSNSVSSAEESSTNVTTTSGDQFGLNNVWLIHQMGYSQAKIFAKIIHKNEASGDVSQVKFKIRLDNGSLIEVNEENLEKANPAPQYDYCEDLSQLRFINETSLLHVLRQRYLTLKLIYTYIGILFTINYYRKVVPIRPGLV